MASEKTTRLVFQSAFAASLGGLLFGFDTAVISGTTEALKSVFSLNDWQLGFTVSSALIGTILGAATIQFPANQFGRKPTLAMIALLYLVSAIGSAFPLLGGLVPETWGWHSFIFFRFLGGIGVGGASVVSPLYTAEIAPPKRRGFLVALTQFNIVFGILLAYVSNYIIARLSLGATEWRWMFGVEAVPAALFLLAVLGNPESPRWLVARGRFDQARALLAKLLPDASEVDVEFSAIKESLETERQGAVKDRLFCWRYRKPILLAFAIAAFNQLSGINTIMYYAPKVFAMTGASKSASYFFPMIIGLTNFVATTIAIFCIDKFGRKKLMYAGSIGYILSLAFVGAIFTLYSSEFDAAIKRLDAEAQAPATAALEPGVTVDDAAADDASATADASTPDVVATASAVPKFGVVGVLVGLMVFIASHAFGQGACIWVFISEIFPNSVRAQGNALGCFTHWIMNAIISGLFPPLLAIFGPALIFFSFAVFMVGQLLWVAFVMPETKHVPLEDMMKKLGVE